MPPVLGPSVAVEDPLVVLRRCERDRALAVAEAQQGQLLAFEELLEHDLGLAEAPLGEEHVERDAGLALVLGDDHALPGRQHVCLEHRGIGRAGDVRGGLVAVAEEDVRCGRHAARLHQLLGIGLRALDASGGLRRSERGDAGRRELVHQPGHQRGLRSDDHEVDLSLARESDQVVVSQALDPSRAMPALPGAASNSGRRGLRPSVRTSACSRPPAPTTRTRAVIL